MFGRFDYEPVGIMDATHLRWFTAKSLRSLLEHHGLTILQMSQTAGFNLSCYRSGMFRLIPTRLRNKFIGLGLRLFPLFCGAQHVVKAQVAISDESSQ